MAMVGGKYVETFAEASHALPQGMHMNADYPLMIPRIVSLKDGVVTLAGSDGKQYQGQIKHKMQTGFFGSLIQLPQQYCFIAQSSSFERMFNRGPIKFEFHPFKDENTPAIAPKPPAPEPTPAKS